MNAPSYNQDFEAKRQSAKTSDGEWDYWTKCYAPAVEFAKAAITPDMTPEQKQGTLLATLRTMEQWTREG